MAEQIDREGKKKAICAAGDVYGEQVVMPCKRKTQACLPVDLNLKEF